ncbi:MAG: hypothetical protein WC610_04225 [Patescibacteria group bacterium]
MGRVANKKTPQTQKYVSIAEIKDDAVVLRDGTLRAVLLISSINFALKSDEEQNAIIAGYVSFLNSLDTSLQIVIQSRRLNLDEYVATLKKAEKEQTNDLLKLQTAEYRQYITELVELGDIMTKRFYVVVPYNPVSNKKRSFWSHTKDVLSPTGMLNLNQKQFLKRRKELFILVDKIISGLSSMSLRSSILDTQSLIELYYNTYNPSVSEREKMADIQKLKVEENYI